MYPRCVLIKFQSICISSGHLSVKSENLPLQDENIPDQMEISNKTMETSGSTSVVSNNPIIPDLIMHSILNSEMSSDSDEENTEPQKKLNQLRKLVKLFRHI